MGRIVYTIGEIKGSVGGVTFQNNSSGHIIRQRPTVKKTSTIRQQLAHSKHQAMLYAWSQLTNGQKDDWNLFAETYTKENKFGETKKLTGANWFTSTNFQRLLMGLTLLTSPPPHDLPAAAPEFTINLYDNDITLTITGPIDYDVSDLIVWCSMPTNRVKPTINNIRKYCTIKKTGTAGTFSIKAEWENATGLLWQPLDYFPNANIFVCLETVRITSGITSPLLCAKTNTSTITPSVVEDTALYYS